MMTLSSLLQVGCIAIILSLPLPLFAQEETPPTPRPMPEALKQPVVAKEIVFEEDNFFIPESVYTLADKKFDFDWSNYSTIALNQANVPEIETLLKPITVNSNISELDKPAVGNLLYKLGTYYLYVTRQPGLAIPKLELAAKFLTNVDAKAWNDDQLAYAYEQKFTLTKQAADLKKALFYTNIVINEVYPHEKTKELAFAYCVQGMTQSNLNQPAAAAASFKNAFNIYETIPDGKDDLYARAKNKYGSLLLQQSGQEQQALSLLEESKQYWMQQGNLYQTPYAAKNFINLAKAYLKTGRPANAFIELNRAITIYKSLYGANSKQLIYPYQLLSETYAQLGDTREAQTYLKKSRQFPNS